MKLKLALVGKGGATNDLVVTVEPTVTIADLAATLARRDPSGRDPTLGEPLTLALWSGPHDTRPIPADFTLLEAGLRSGAAVRIVSQQPSTGVAAGAPSVATVRVLAGPDTGREFEVPEGTTYIGRDASCDIRLDDPMVSKQHAKLHITTVPELVDTNSANGVILDGDFVARVVLRPDDQAVLGDTTIAVAMHKIAGAKEAQGTAIPFNRSPRISPFYPERELEAPDLPEPMQSQRLPIISLITPIIMGSVLYFVTHSALSFVMVGLTPLMAIGTYTEGRVTRKRAYERGLEAFRSAIAELDGELARGAVEEKATRLQEHPATAEIAEAVGGLSPLVWTRRRDEQGFLQVRLGLGPRPSRTTLKRPQNAKQRGEGLSDIDGLQHTYGVIDGVPVVADLKHTGALGISGDDAMAHDLARGVISQIVGLHSPAEVVLAALASPVTAPNWDWIKWTPHVSSPNSPLESPHLAVGRGACLNLVAEIEALIAARAAMKAPERAEEVRVVLLVEDDAAIERSRLVDIAEHGAAHDVLVVWHSPATEQLPAACRTYLEVNRSAGTIGTVYVDDRERVQLSDAERIDPPTAMKIAKRMSPLVDTGAPVEDSSDLPGSVSFVTLAGPELASSPAAVLERWNESNSVIDRRPDAARRRLKESTLRAVIGRSATDALYLDLRTNGPHALVGGTTGAGKSELLQSWIIGMAATYSPDRVTFLLVDYKGGSAFGECRDLPHTVGMVTDLSLHLARRALTSLVAELRFREHILSRKRAKDLIELERTGDPDAPPSLVIVIDEFAALVQELPEFVDGVVNVAQRGRSLGLHLILATQRPAGVIKDNLRANTNLRIALRMADEADSTDVLGTPIAASFDPAIPGRAMAKLGPGRLVGFQSAYVGGRTSETPAPPAVIVEELVFGPSRRWEEPEQSAVQQPPPSGPPDIRRLVATFKAAAGEGGIPAPRLPWLAELAPIYELSRLPTARKDSELVFGVRDDPDNQAQPVAVFYPDRDGNMVVYGTGGAGKSTTLRTLAIAAGFNVRGGPCHVYGLDFGSRGLDLLADLPHVGAIINGDDGELVVRLLRTLRATVDERAARYAKMKAGTITEYRSLAGHPDEPRVLLLVDAVGAFRQAYEVGENAKWFEMFVGIVQDGRPVGVSVVVTGDRPAALPSAVASSMQRSLVLRMATDNDYAMLGMPTGSLGTDAAPGRGLQDKMELQVAVLGGSANVAEQAAAVDRLAAAMRRNGVGDAPPIERLRDRVFLSELPVAVGDLPVIGLAEETLGPLPISPKGTFVVSGPPGSGRTSALATMATALRRWRPDACLAYLGPVNGTLTGTVDWDHVALGPDAIAATAAELTSALKDGSLGDRVVAVIVEGIVEFLNTAADMPLQDLAAALLADGKLLVVDGEPGSISGSWPLLQAVKISRYGVALQPEQAEGTGVYKTNFPRVSRGQFPEGRGLLVAGGRTSVVQLALAEQMGSSPRPEPLQASPETVILQTHHS